MAEESEATSSTSQPSSSPDTGKKSQVPGYSGLAAFQNGDLQMFPVMYPAIIPGLTSLQNQEQTNRGAGIYAVPVLPFMGHIAGLPSNTLIPLTYNIPTYTGGQSMPVLPCFSSKLRYQTGALTPLIRWLSQGMHRAAAPPHLPRPAARAENVPAAGRQGNDNAALAEGQAGAENENQPADDGNQAVENENENAANPGLGNGGNHWWGIVKEIQMIVFGFITSLLPGFNNIE
ncbi:uncharacterized protein LOC110410264 [Herrania umbratica]|uniref:Uncharacterized protein LOC110410264 n=1 Tax=Herrania umbratica TaxID=108875 RepID=A0A6J0ZMS1_9ROSI|nr:uncharacterized protein LOC110410264 [Herrania umbratica]